jgi:hypothetical protein
MVDASVIPEQLLSFGMIDEGPLEKIPHVDKRAPALCQAGVFRGADDIVRLV